MSLKHWHHCLLHHSSHTYEVTSMMIPLQLLASRTILGRQHQGCTSLTTGDGATLCGSRVVALYCWCLRRVWWPSGGGRTNVNRW